MRTVLTTIVLLGYLGATVSARDIFVNNGSGDDRNEGVAAVAQFRGGGPVRSISKALRLAEAGDRIVVANSGEPYRETLSLVGSRHSGSTVRPFVVEGGGAVLDGTVPIPDADWQHVIGDVFAYQPERLGSQQLFLLGKVAIERPVPPAAVTLPPLEPQEWCFWQGRIYFRVDHGHMPPDYRPSCCGLATGITLYYVRDLLVRDLTVQGFQRDGVAVHDVVRETRLERITSRANGQSGVSVRGASWVELDGCALTDNRQSQLRVADFSRCWLYDCQLEGLSAPAIQRSGGTITIDEKPFAAGN